MKLLITLLVIVTAVYGLYNFTMATYGWFQMSTIVEEAATAELARPGTSGFGGFDARSRFGHIRERILKGSKEANVDLRPENVVLDIVDNMLDVRLTWTAPMLAFGGKTYLEIPMSMQRAFPIKPRSSALSGRLAPGRLAPVRLAPVPIGPVRPSPRRSA